MNCESIDFCQRICLAHASLKLKLDDELGTHHGLSLNDFVLLRLLDACEDGAAEVAALARPMGVAVSQLTRQLLPLEKIGLLQRRRTDDGRRVVALRAAGSRVLNEAMHTALMVCDAAVAGLPAPQRAATDGALVALCQTRALAL